MKKQGILLIISGPSGSGKGTIVGQLCEKNDFALSISATTRKPRENEENGVHYFFHTREEFEQMRDRKELLEWAEFCGNYYGTPRKYVTEQLMQGKNVILEIEVQGALQVKKIYPEGVLVFMVPPNLEELGRRLTNRGTEDKETINMRLRRALEEMELVDEYDYLVINDTIEQATEDILTIVDAEGMKCSRNKDIKKIFKGEM
ncbi:MAG: guanylate kinase [Anaerotignum sp.]|nr:guanylate kinase [Anaerotignum sp.]MBR2061718.1 guanylate kinase [Anaerotignum sp.]MBR2383730.1 guanylate kinase [Anaerotignum sp.]MBR2851864.1 guanylate kinase [Anaerotignum sp.]MBR3910087.1 guanylate kinase [Anaerotignum sp.]